MPASATAARRSPAMDRRARCMLLIHAAYTAANLLAGTFLSIFLWRASHDLTLIALFNGVTALLIPIAFLSNGLVWRGTSAGTSIRFGLTALGLSYLAILTLGEESTRWIVPLGMLRGVGEGWYWSGYHLVSYDATRDADRDRYFGAMGAVNWLFTAGLPPIAGLVIAAGTRFGGTERGYQAVFLLAAVVLLGAMVSAGRLSGSGRPAFSLAAVVGLHRRNPAWGWVARARLAEGFSGSLGGLVLTVLLFLVLRNEQQVGNFNGLMGLLGVSASLALALFLRPRHRIPCAMAGAVLLVLSTLVLPLYLSAGALIAFGLLRALGNPLHSNALAPLAFHVIDRDPNAKVLRYEYIVHQELCLGVGRVLSVVAFLLLAAPVDQLLLARIVVVVCGAAPMIIWAAFARIPPAGAAAADNRPLSAAA